jgi:MYXO-CTERM domain-containing protein
LLASGSAAAWIYATGANASAAADETFSVRVRAFCASETDVCGYASKEEFVEATLVEFQVANRIWEPVGISFYPTVDFEFGTPYTELEDHEIPILAAEADDLDHALTLNIIPTLDGGFSSLPVVGATESPSWDWNKLFQGAPHGATFAHELGHHFCMPHTHRDNPNDPFEVAGAVDHDGDGYADTPADPGRPEVVSSDQPPQAWASADVIADPVNGDIWYADREWCVFVAIPTDDPAVMWCDPTCFGTPGGAFVPIAYEPHTQLVMSYYGECEGPWIRNGIVTEAISADGIAAIHDCRAEIPDRAALVDICPGAGGGDADSDGVCDGYDNCVDVKNTAQDDADGDFLGDACDQCPLDAQPDTNDEDSDGDGYGDLCDPDDDNDGCADDIDDDPSSPLVVGGHFVHANCPDPVTEHFVNGGVDHDGDGVLSCNDLDDDNDGIPDGDDECPLHDGDVCYSDGVSCPLDTYCWGPGCDGYELTLVNAVNPEWTFTFVDFWIGENGTVWIAREPGLTLSQTAMALLGHQFPSISGDDAFRLELRRGTETVAVVAEYRAAQVQLGELVRGVTIALEQLTGQPVIGATWARGLAIGDAPFDGDGDGWPDPADNCVQVSDRSQLDTDRDGYGNACDPDFDQDGRVDEADLHSIEECFGVVVVPAPRLVLDSTESTGVTEQYLHARACVHRDLDGSGTVDELDYEIGIEYIDMPPGPSANIDEDDDTLSSPTPIDEDAQEDAATDAAIVDDETEARGTGCGCRSGTGSGLAAVAGLTLLVRRRRRARST